MGDLVRRPIVQSKRVGLAPILPEVDRVVVAERGGAYVVGGQAPPVKMSFGELKTPASDPPMSFVIGGQPPPSKREP